MIRRTLLAAFVLALPVGLTAQGAKGTGSRWILDDARGSFCVSYLADPALAEQLVPKGTELTPASAVTELTPMLARVIRDEPQFATWIPSAICAGFYGAVTIDGEVAARAKGERGILVMTHSVAAKAPRGQQQAGNLLLELSTDNGVVARMAENAGIRIERRDAVVTPSREGGDDIMTLQVDKAKLVWSGHRTGEPRVDVTQMMSYGLEGRRNTNYQLVASFAPDTVWAVVGQLRIEGKDDLAKTLKASPIRAVGPIRTGGRAEWFFTRGGND